MKFRSCVLFCFISLFCLPFVLAQPLSSPENALAEALVKATTEEEQERLLAQKQELMNSALLAALKKLADPLTEKGDYPQALKIYQLAVRLAERIGDRRWLGTALADVGASHIGQNRNTQALDTLQKSLAIGEETGYKEVMERVLFMIGNVHRLQGQYEQALTTYNRGLAISEETGNKSLTARITNNIGIILLCLLLLGGKRFSEAGATHL